MEKEKRKRSEDELLSPRQRYLPLIIMLILAVLSIFLVAPALMVNSLAQLVPKRSYWTEYTLSWLYPIVYLTCAILPFLFGIYLHRRQKQYSWTYHKLIFGLLALPIIFCNLFVFMRISTWHHFDSLEHSGNIYHLAWSGQGWDDSPEIYYVHFYRCNSQNVDCEHRLYNNFGYTPPNEFAMQSMELIVLDQTVYACLIDIEHRAYLIPEEFDRYSGSFVRYHTDNHPQCNVESVQ